MVDTVLIFLVFSLLQILAKMAGGKPKIQQEKKGWCRKPF